MLVAGFFFGLMNLFVKFLPHIPAIEIILFRSIVSFFICLILLRKQRIPIFGTKKGLLISRGVVGAGALILYFITLQKIPLASAVTLHFLSPIFTTILGIYIVKEKVHPLQWIFFLVSFTGIFFLQGFDTRISIEYLVLGISAAFFSGIAYNIIRKLKTAEHPLVIVFYFPLITIPIVGIYSIFNWVQPSGWDWVILLCIGIFTQVAQYYMTKAYQADEISKVASINYISILYALGYGFIFFGETFNFMTYIGMLLIIAGVFANIWIKKLQQTKEV
jgi:drug/metabolite transporter (DMT)-like permease